LLPKDARKEIKFYKSRKKKDAERKKRAISIISQSLNIRWYLDGEDPNDDHLDSVICGIAAVADAQHLCSVEDYRGEEAFSNNYEEVLSQLAVVPVPDSYRIVKQNPFREIKVCQQPFGSWIESHNTVV